MKAVEQSAPFKGPGNALALSPQARVLWAKTGSEEERGLWSPLYVHMGDSACIARLLWNEWLADSAKRQIVDSACCDDESAAALVSWLAGVHDIGKAAPGFQYKVPDRAEPVRKAGLNVPDGYAIVQPSPHAYMGEVILEKWLGERGWKYSWLCGSIVGAHHGSPPSDDEVLHDIEIESVNFPNERLGDESWHSVQSELLEWMFVATGMAEYEGSFRDLELSQPAQVLISALVIVSDWIASNSELFPLVPCIETCEELCQRAKTAWAALALPPSWHAGQVEVDGEELFHQRFKGLPDDAKLRAVQLEALDTAFNMEEPGLLIIEAPMGSGKTEASLLCAEVMAAKFGAGGVAYLLPTMATSNAMFARVEEWLEAIPDARGGSRQSMQLLHSKAELNPDYARLRSWGGTWMGDEARLSAGEGVVAHQWFAGRKRGLLSSFVVGTVDQLLMAALKTRHAQLRHLGLAGKVVVIDEVHAYDAYVSTYLDRVLTWLGAYGVPVILLSATLPANRRNELIRAYRGRDRKSPGRGSRRKDIPQSPRDEAGNPAYPLITAATRVGALDEDMYRTCRGSSAGTDVLVQRMEDDSAALVAKLGDLLSDGGCACVLRDTVSRAQSTYEVLKQAFGESCVKLVHSRFIAVDRMANDAELLRLLGPDPANRPEKLIVVGTQVIEQSLDIDFDAMITDAAPVDLLLQRAGRLHRHQRGAGQSQRPEKLRQARLFITGVEDWDAVPFAMARGIDCVYPEALLWKSLLALQPSGDEPGAMVNLPHDIASLVELVYSSDDASEKPVSAVAEEEWVEALRDAEEDLRRKQESACLRAGSWLMGKPGKQGKGSLIGWLREACSLMDDAKGRAAVRDTEESIEVVVVQGDNDELKLLPWVADEANGQLDSRSLGDGSDVPDDELARTAANCTVSLPPRLSSGWNCEQVIDALEAQAQVPGWQESRWLRGQLVLILDSAFGATIETASYVYRLRYSREAGLELVRRDNKGEGGE